GCRSIKGSGHTTVCPGSQAPTCNVPGLFRDRDTVVVLPERQQFIERSRLCGVADIQRLPRLFGVSFPREQFQHKIKSFFYYMHNKTTSKLCRLYTNWNTGCCKHKHRIALACTRPMIFARCFLN